MSNKILYVTRHGRNFEGSRLSIQVSCIFMSYTIYSCSLDQWAKNPPSSVWRYDRRTPPNHRPSRERERSRSPRRRSDRDERDRERDGDRDRDRDRDREREVRRRRSRTPERRRSPSPERRRDDRMRTTPPPDRDIDVKKDDDRAMTPPYDH